MRRFVSLVLAALMAVSISASVVSAQEMDPGAEEMLQVAEELGAVAAELDQAAEELGQVAEELGQAVEETAPVAEETPPVAVEMGPTYSSTTSTLSIQLLAGWEPIPTDPALLGNPWTEVLQATNPDGRVVTVGVHPLPGGMPVDDTYKALMEADASNVGGQILNSDIVELPAVHSATGSWHGVLQIYFVPQAETTVEVVRFMLPIGEQQYALTVVGGPGSASVSGAEIGVLAAGLIP